MASETGRAAGALQRGYWFWQLDGVRKSRFLSLPRVSRGLPNKSGKPNQLLGLRNFCRMRCARSSSPCPEGNLKRLAGDVICHVLRETSLVAQVGVLSDHWYAPSPRQVCTVHSTLSHQRFLGTVMLPRNLVYCVAEKLRGFNRFLEVLLCPASCIEDLISTLN